MNYDEIQPGEVPDRTAVIAGLVLSLIAFAASICLMQLDVEFHKSGFYGGSLLCIWIISLITGGTLLSETPSARIKRAALTTSKIGSPILTLLYFAPRLFGELIPEKLGTLLIELSGWIIPIIGLAMPLLLLSLSLYGWSKLKSVSKKC